MIRIVFVIVALFCSGQAYAQVLQQSGKVTPGHVGQWTTSGVLQDGGSANNGSISNLGLLGTGYPFCINDAPASSNNYHQLCLGANVLSGGAVLSFQHYGTTSALPLLCNINGITTPCLGSVNGLATIATNAALKALAVGTYSTVYRAGFSTAGDGGAAYYNYSSSSCSLNSGAGDNGSQVAPTTGGGCWLASFAGTQPNPKIWGAAGDGSTDDSAVFLTAATALAGSTLYTGPYSYYFGTSKTLPNALTLQCSTEWIGAIAPNGSSVLPYGSIPHIAISSSVSVSLGSSDRVNGCLVYRGGMTFPAAGSSAFAGTAFTAAGDSISITHSMIMGFSLALYSNGYVRGTITDDNVDNQGNWSINNSGDTWKIGRIHAWPFSVGASPPASYYVRTGTNLNISGSTGSDMISDYLAFGYQNGFAFPGSSDITCSDCDADATGLTLASNAQGFSMTGSTANQRLTLIKPQSYGYAVAVYKNVSGSGSALQIFGGTSGSNGACLESDSNDTGVIVSSGNNCNSANNVLVDNNTSAVISFVGGSAFSNIVSNPYFSISGAPTTITVAPDTIVPFGGGAGQYLESNSAVIPSTAVSANAIAIPITGGAFIVTGTGTAGSLNSCSYAGRVVTLEFAGVVTLTNSGPSGTLNQMSFTSGSNYTSANGSSVSLLCLGGNTPWIEISHS